MAVFSNLVLVFLSVIAYTAIALENGTFEFSAAGWKNVAGQYRYDRTAGRNGTGAIIFESTDPATDIAVPEQIIPVEAGRIYDFYRIRRSSDPLQEDSISVSNKRCTQKHCVYAYGKKCAKTTQLGRFPLDVYKKEQFICRICQSKCNTFNGNFFAWLF
jgi:hypothetical protein